MPTSSPTPEREAAREIAALRESERILQRQIDAQAAELDRVRTERDKAKRQAATSRAETIAAAADGLDGLGEKQAAYLLRTVDVVEGGAS
ncbi:hypothetical protein [Streptomyces sp.]|uniref:hypothetical protein n=1 Tax=Streptomyces sp. TaxID=1931 RepID=UPI002F922BD8